MIRAAEAMPDGLPRRVPDTCVNCGKPSLAAVCVACKPEVEAARLARLARDLATTRAGAIRHAREAVPIRWRHRRLRGGSPPLESFLFHDLRQADAARADALARKAIADVAKAPASAWVIVLGARLTGKTSLAVAAAMARIDLGERQPDSPAGREARGFRFATAIDLGRARREHRLGTPDPAEIAELEQAPFALIDNLGAGGAREDEVCAQVLDARFQAGLLTYGTSPFTPEELDVRFGRGGVARPMFEAAVVIDLDPEGQP
ncbi:MAG: hypothetical protein EKK55_18100 [Rhodocyclaceae bacterium]|nr:MAG: hypothetical protein EKK55_18100 [Rhodocyclaceae bacterium]